MRIYDVTNTARHTAWLLARDEGSVVALALRLGHIRKASSAEIHDVTDEMLSKDTCADQLQTFLDGEVEGQLSKEIPMQSIADLFGPPQVGPRGRWLLWSGKDLRDAYGNIGHLHDLPALDLAPVHEDSVRALNSLTD